MCVSVCIQRRGSESQELDDGCEQLGGRWQLTLGPLQESPILLTTELSLQPWTSYFIGLVASFCGLFCFVSRLEVKTRNILIIGLPSGSSEPGRNILSRSCLLLLSIVCPWVSSAVNIAFWREVGRNLWMRCRQLGLASSMLAACRNHLENFIQGQRTYKNRSRQPREEHTQVQCQ